MNQYAPPNDGNNTAGYIATVAKALGVEASATLDMLKPEQRSILAQTIMVQEGGASHGLEFGAPTFTQPKGR